MKVECSCCGSWEDIVIQCRICKKIFCDECAGDDLVSLSIGDFCIECSEKALGKFYKEKYLL